MLKKCEKDAKKERKIINKRNRREKKNCMWACETLRYLPISFWLSVRMKFIEYLASRINVSISLHMQSQTWIHIILNYTNAMKCFVVRLEMDDFMNCIFQFICSFLHAIFACIYLSFDFYFYTIFFLFCFFFVCWFSTKLWYASENVHR